jgi:hypothetical protein
VKIVNSKSVLTGACRSPLFLLAAIALALPMVTGCATTKPDPFETQLAAMSDAELISYYHGINDRLKEIQSGTREADRQGIIRQDDQIAKMPYIIGGEAWELARKRGKVRKMLDQRHISP